jgi:hypothetical protein
MVNLRTIKAFMEKLSVEDRIVLFRFLVGVLYGLIVYLASLFTQPIKLTPIAWSASVMAYYTTVIYVAVKYKPTSKFQLYLRGLATFYATWILTVIILFELSKTLGVV